MLFNLWGHHHDDRIWPEPFRFKPERFLKEDGDLVLAGQHPRNQFFGFGAGTRVCLGEVLAMTRLFLFISSIAQQFTVLPATTIEEQASIHPSDFSLGIVLNPQPYNARFVPRK